MEYIVPRLRIVAFTNIVDPDIMKERMSQLITLEEYKFIAGFHKKVQKEREKSWHENHIN